MGVWRCDLEPATVSRLVHYVSTTEFPRSVTVEVPEGAGADDVRERARNALVAKMTANGGRYASEIAMALAGRESMRCERQDS